MKLLKSVKSRNNTKAKNIKKSKIKRNLKGGFNMNPELAIEPLFQKFIENHKLSCDIFRGGNDLDPLIKEDANIRIISVHNGHSKNIVDFIKLQRTADIAKYEIINVPNPNEKIYFLKDSEKKGSWDIEFNQIYDFNTLLLNSNTAITEIPPECNYDKNFPLISFFYSKALTLAYWNVIYSQLNLNGTGKKLNIFNFHMNDDVSPFIRHFATSNSINVMISCKNAGIENGNAIDSILSRYIKNKPIFIGFSDWITVWGSNLMARRNHDRINLPEQGKECNNILNKVQAVSYYMDNWVRSKYTQDIIFRNIRDMIQTDSATIQVVDETKCAVVNLAERARLGHAFVCPNEIQYLPHRKPHALLPADLSNQEELLFRTYLTNDIATRLDPVNYNTHLQLLKQSLTPQILAIINDKISSFNESYSLLLSILMNKVSKGDMDIDDYIEFISRTAKSMHPILKQTFGLDQYFDTIVKNLQKLCPNQWYTEKLNITLDFIEITIDPNIGCPNATLKFDLHTGLFISGAVDPSFYNIDGFLLYIAQFEPQTSYTDYSVDSDF